MKKTSTKILVEGALIVALATILSFIRVMKLPWGGSVTLLSMLPITLFSVRRGLRAGLAASVLFSLIQFFQGITDGLFGWGLTPGMLIACILLDYLLAYSVLGLAGLFGKKTYSGAMTGITLSVALRFLVHFLSGIIIWKSVGALWGNFTTDNFYLYSFLYNGAYMLPELIF
ncbi:MAG: energy-coupled thiamine transporter ThiT, partial [Lachnospiraceae bacterium]|nr:energy-coupled thiamine transporter ThiT [Lachnospiraceae bacterium]